MVEIRKATRKDINGIWPVEIENRLYHKNITPERYSELNNNSVNEKFRLEFIKTIEKDLKKKGNILIVAEEKNKIIGYAQGHLFRWRWSDNPPKTANLKELVILKQYRRKGVATKILKEFEETAENMGARFLCATVWIKNKSAFKFYKKNKLDKFSVEMVKKLK